MNAGKMDMIEATLSERLPTVDETAIASKAVAAMGKALTPKGSLPIQVRKDGSEVSIELPPSVGQLILDVLAHIASGEMVTVVPYGTELTTQEAADLLNVSRPFLTKLLESGQIEFHRVGSHRRVKAQDLLAYKKKRDIQRSIALRELQQMGQEIEASERDR